jgi:hypothetical protein
MTYIKAIFWVKSEINKIRQREVFLEIFIFLLVNDLTFRAKQLNVLKRWIVSTLYVGVWYKIRELSEMRENLYLRNRLFTKIKYYHSTII